MMKPICVACERFYRRSKKRFHVRIEGTASERLGPSAAGCQAHAALMGLIYKTRMAGRCRLEHVAGCGRCRFVAGVGAALDVRQTADHHELPRPLRGMPPVNKLSAPSPLVRISDC